MAFNLVTLRPRVSQIAPILYLLYHLFTGCLIAINSLTIKTNNTKIRILSWNARGASRKGFKTKIKKLRKIHNLDIISSMETKVNSNKAQTIIQSISMPNYVEILTDGSFRGSWLIWKYIFGFHMELFPLVIDFSIIILR